MPRSRAGRDGNRRGSPVDDAAPVLSTADLTRHFGMVKAVDGITVEIARGALVGIVGANGSGKTTFLNLITGYLTPDRGRIEFMGRETTGLPPRAVTKLGIARSFQVPQLYTGLSVPPRVAEGLQILERFGLGSYADRPVGQLAEGGRKLLDIALSFALRPRLLLMDEPTSGVSIDDKGPVMDTLVGVLRQSDVTTIFVEHDMDVVQRYARRVLVFDNGRVIAQGETGRVLADAEVRKAILGHA
ncbi:MAG: ABC transporter ATP-binding protein [Bacillati bacterium ANGP1]|uniref:ABC transporter ATP-binding protein n=1 Tax=Candidatus Segetimicrobium genomatis TaxID=2569760 RepID=A0A537J5C5_9BACT|nr:MAG: ABC transporter ATP-binding protein [Terrabacteria group bacterium ANGP1]